MGRFLHVKKRGKKMKKNEKLLLAFIIPQVC